MFFKKHSLFKLSPGRKDFIYYHIILILDANQFFNYNLIKIYKIKCSLNGEPILTADWRISIPFICHLLD